MVSSSDFNVPIFGCNKNLDALHAFPFISQLIKIRLFLSALHPLFNLIFVVLTLYSNNPLLSDVTRARHSWTLENFFFFFFTNRTLNEYVARQFSLN